MTSRKELLDVIEKFVSPNTNLTQNPMTDIDGNILSGLSNLSMVYMFEELVRKFIEENNEKTGEHFTPREVITQLALDPACASGGMLTESRNFIEEKYPNGNRDIHMYGKEINDETYAICKSDMMIKVNSLENARAGSTLSTDEFA